MSYYFIGNPDPEDPCRWAFNTSVNSTQALVEALQKAGFHVVIIQNSESISPYLGELDISKPGATREEVEKICKAVDVAPPKSTRPRFGDRNARF